MRQASIAVLILLLSSALLAQSDATKQSQPSSGSTESNLGSQQPPPTKHQPSKTVDSTHLVITKFKRPVYPLDAQREQLRGQVWVHLVIDEAGNVVTAEPISGDPVLVSAAVDAMKHWQFQPYIHDGHPVRVSTKLPYDFAVSDKASDTPVSAVAGDSAPGAKTSAAAPEGGGAANTGTGPAPVPVDSAASRGVLLHKVAPGYPEWDRLARIQGTVVLEAIIGKDGAIKALKVVHSPSDGLAQAAITAVQQWRYKPYIKDGKPVEVSTTINVNFQLR
ncbi:MAG: energy transducer TonB [Candidatus Korobacteraceae bacterium]